MYTSEVLQDIKALGGLPLFGIAIVVSFLFGEVRLSAQLLLGLVLSFGLTTLIRIVYFRPRPDKQAYGTFFQKVDASSFPSLHSMRAAVLAVLMMFFFNQLLISVLLGLCVITVAVCRVLLKRHHVSDVIAGIIFGTIIAFVSVWLVARFIS